MLKGLFTWPLALLILFEEWGWEPLQKVVGWFARLPLLRALERRIALLPPYAALVVFFAPTLLLLPVKLLALWLIGQGRSFLGVAIIVVAKIAGTALVARLFMLTQPALMQLPWFARLYVRWTAWKNALIARVRASAAWKAIAVAKAETRAMWRRIKGAFLARQNNR